MSLPQDINDRHFRKYREVASGVAVAVTIESSALPTGSATEAKQDTQISVLNTIDADTGAIKTAVETLDNAISGNEMQVDVLTAPSVSATGSTIPANATMIGIRDASGNLVAAKSSDFGDNQGGSLSVTPYYFDGVTYDRARGDSTDGLLVNLGVNNDVTVELDGTALSNNQVTVDTTSGGVTIIAASAGRQGVLVKNQGSVTAYIGTGTVSSSNGMELKAGESLSIPTDSEVKGIVASSTTVISYLAVA